MRDSPRPPAGVIVLELQGVELAQIGARDVERGLRPDREGLRALLVQRPPARAPYLRVRGEIMGSFMIRSD
jgi:hypothetical protein